MNEVFDKIDLETWSRNDEMIIVLIFTFETDIILMDIGHLGSKIVKTRNILKN